MFKLSKQELKLIVLAVFEIRLLFSPSNSRTTVYVWVFAFTVPRAPVYVVCVYVSLHSSVGLM